MKKTLLYTTLAYIVAMLFTISSCKKHCHDSHNPDCENYDKCWDAVHVTADFTVTEYCSYLNDTPKDTLPYVDYFCDTISGSSTIFTPKYPDKPNTTYKWNIGSQTFNTRKVSLSFVSAMDGAVIPIRLDIKTTPNLSCFPHDDSIATFTKNIYVKKNNYNYVGKWQGYFTDSPSVIKTFTIDTFTRNGYFKYGIYNLYSKDSFDVYPKVNMVKELVFETSGFDTTNNTTYFEKLDFGTILVDSTNNNLTIWNLYFYRDKHTNINKQFYRTLYAKRQ